MDDFMIFGIVGCILLSMSAQQSRDDERLSQLEEQAAVDTVYVVAVPDSVKDMSAGEWYRLKMGYEAEPDSVGVE